METKFRVWKGDRFLKNGEKIHDECFSIGGDINGDLNDKNGKEIYEGDIVKFHPWNSPNKQYEEYLCKSLKQIRWGLDVHGQYPSVGFVAISLHPSDLEDGHQLNWMDARNMEVIGNIFEKLV